MKHTLLISILLVISFSACKEPQDPKTKLITQKWLAESSSETEMDEQLVAFLDTVGTNTTPEQNEVLYGTRNMDSVKANKRIIEDRIAMQKHALENTWIQFYDNGTAVRHFSGLTDSAKWAFSNDGNLIFSNPNNANDTLMVNVESLTDSVLRLKMDKNGEIVNMVFHPAKK